MAMATPAMRSAFVGPVTRGEEVRRENLRHKTQDVLEAAVTISVKEKQANVKLSETGAALVIKDNALKEKQDDNNALEKKIAQLVAEKDEFIKDLEEKIEDLSIAISEKKSPGTIPYAVHWLETATGDQTRNSMTRTKLTISIEVDRDGKLYVDMHDGTRLDDKQVKELVINAAKATKVAGLPPPSPPQTKDAVNVVDDAALAVDADFLSLDSNLQKVFSFVVEKANEASQWKSQKIPGTNPPAIANKETLQKLCSALGVKHDKDDTVNVLLEKLKNKFGDKFNNSV